MSLYLLGATTLVLGLLISIALHEYGHLLAARKFKVSVSEFMIGFGPAIYSRVSKKGLMIGLRAIPLGGYIKIRGMFPIGSKYYQDDLDSKDTLLEFYKIHPLKKIVIMLAGPLANFLLSIIFIAIAFLAVGIPTPSTVIESLPECLNVNDSNKNCIKATAVSSGILANDKIVGIEDKKIKNWDDFIYYIDIYKGGNVNLVIERGNTILSKEVEILEYNSRGYIGVVPKIDYKQGSIIMVYKVVNDMFGRTLSAIARFPERIIEVSKIVFTEQKRDPNGPIGIVGLTRVSGEIAQGDDPDKEKILSILFLLAGLNMSLFIFNLIPLVPLDGGNAFAAIIEYLKRLYNRAVGRNGEFYLDPAKYIYLTYLIAIILVTTSFLLIIADIFKPISIS